MAFESDSDYDNGIVASEKNVNNEVSDAPNGIVKDWDAEEGPLRRKYDHSIQFLDRNRNWKLKIQNRLHPPPYPRNRLFLPPDRPHEHQRRPDFDDHR